MQAAQKGAHSSCDTMRMDEILNGAFPMEWNILAAAFMRKERSLLNLLRD
jgi:hypothetical protein